MERRDHKNEMDDYRWHYRYYPGGIPGRNWKFNVKKEAMIKVGLFGIGLDTYWDQFDGLLNRLKTYQKQIADKIEEFGAEVVDAGLVDSPKKAREAGDYLKKNDVEIVFLYVSTYALSSTVFPVAQKLKCPIIILNIQPVA